jgi:FtsH-binding integral membrane protein
MSQYQPSGYQDLNERSLPGVSDAARATFLGRVYGHLLGALVAFTLLEIALFKTGAATRIFEVMMGVPWLVWLGGFMLVGFLATRFAQNAASPGKQYFGLGLYIVAEALIFVPLLYIADMHAEGVIANAAIVTLVGFSGLTAIVFVTRKDFSFLRSVLMWGTFAAIGFIVIGSFAGWSGGTFFPVLMIALAGGWILHDTSRILLHYPEDRYVGAALELFASVALMFWYVIMLFLSRD